MTEKDDEFAFLFRSRYQLIPLLLKASSRLDRHEDHHRTNHESQRQC